MIEVELPVPAEDTYTKLGAHAFDVSFVLNAFASSDNELTTQLASGGQARVHTTE